MEQALELIYFYLNSINSLWSTLKNLYVIASIMLCFSVYFYWTKRVILILLLKYNIIRTSLNNGRCISLLNTYYKIIAKLLAFWSRSSLLNYKWGSIWLFWRQIHRPKGSIFLTKLKIFHEICLRHSKR